MYARIIKVYKVFNNVMIELNDSTHQVDHVAVSKYGIFVIETKNYSGNIYGKEFEEKWIQYLGGKKYIFYNPVRQNYGHIQTLKAALKKPNEKFISIVVFSNRARLKITSRSNVVNLDDLVSTIKHHKDVLLSDNEIEYIVNTIFKLNIVDRKLRKDHVKNIRNTLKINESGPKREKKVKNLRRAK